jgi:hypothetical protein
MTEDIRSRMIRPSGRAMPASLGRRIQLLIEEAKRRRAGYALLDVARHIQEAGIPPMSDEEVVAEVKAI